MCATALVAPAPNLARIRADKVLPAPPALRTMKAPFPNPRPGKEKRPTRAAVEFDSVRRLWPADGDLTSAAARYTAGRMLDVLTPQDHRQVPIRVIVQRPILVGMQEMVQVDVQPSVSRNDPPPTQIWVVGRPDDEIRIAHHFNPMRPTPALCVLPCSCFARRQVRYSAMSSRSNHGLMNRTGSLAKSGSMVAPSARDQLPS